MSFGSLELNLISDDAVVLQGRLAVNGGGQEVKGRLEEFHQHALARKVRCFTVDVRQLTFVNSSAIRFFVDWISKAEKAGYQLRFLTDPSITWQRLSFSALESLAPNTVNIEPKLAARQPDADDELT